MYQQKRAHSSVGSGGGEEEKSNTSSSSLHPHSSTSSRARHSTSPSHASPLLPLSPRSPRIRQQQHQNQFTDEIRTSSSPSNTLYPTSSSSLLSIAAAMSQQQQHQSHQQQVIHSPTSHPSKHTSTMITSDDSIDGEENLQVMWGKSRSQGNGAVTARTRTAQQQQQQQSNQQRSSTSSATSATNKDANLFHKFEDKIASLPILRDAIAAEYAGTTVGGGGGGGGGGVTHRHTTHQHAMGTKLIGTSFPNSSTSSPTPPHLLSLSNSLLSASPISPSNPLHHPSSNPHDTSFSRTLLTHQCGRYVVETLQEAQQMIDALRLELDLLYRIQANERARRNSISSDLNTTLIPVPFPATETNMSVLYMENMKLKELLQVCTERYDTTSTVLDHKVTAFQEEQHKRRTQEMELIQSKHDSIAKEQQVMNLEYEKVKLKEMIEKEKCVVKEKQKEVQETVAKWKELQHQHSSCVTMKTRLDAELIQAHESHTQQVQHYDQLKTEFDSLLSVNITLEKKYTDLSVEVEVSKEKEKERVEEKKREEILQSRLQTEIRTLKESLDQSEYKSVTLQEEALKMKQILQQTRADLETVCKQAKTEAREQVERVYEKRMEERMEEMKELENVLQKERDERVAMIQAHTEATQALQAQLHKRTDEYTALTQELLAMKAHLEKCTCPGGGSEGSINISKPPPSVQPPTSIRTQTPPHTTALIRQQRDDLRHATDTIKEQKALLAALQSKLQTQQEQEVIQTKLKESELKLKESQASHETLRRSYEHLQNRLKQSEAEQEREANLRRIQLKSAKEVKKRLESNVQTLEVKCTALMKAITNGTGTAAAAAISKTSEKVTPELTITTAAADPVASIANGSDSEDPTPAVTPSAKSRPRTAAELKAALEKLQAQKK